MVTEVAAEFSCHGIYLNLSQHVHAGVIKLRVLHDQVPLIH